MPSSQTLTGFVYDAAGKAVSSADVKLYRAGTTTGALSSTVTNASGKWTFALSSATDSNYDAGAVDLDVQITNAATGTVGRIKFEDQVQVERVLARQFLLSPDSNASSGTAARGFFHRITGTTTLGAEMTHTLPKHTGTFLMGKSQDSAGAFVLGDSQTVTSSAAASFKKLTTTSSLEVTGGGVKVNTSKFTTDSDGNTVVAGTLTVGAGDGTTSTDVTFYSATSGDNFTWDASAKKLIITGTNATTAFAVADGNATFADDVTITGSLTVNGTTTTINSTVTTYSDALVKLAQGTTASPAVDLGFIFTRGNGSASNIANRAILWDESNDDFAFAFTNDEDGTTTGNVDIDDYADIHVGAITADDESTFTSKITADAGIDIDNINIDGTTIALSSGDLTLDVAGDIVLDADGDDVSIQAGGSYPLTFTQSASGAWVLKNTTADKAFTIAGNDNGSNVNALVFDMADAGKATFSGNVVVTGDLTISGDDLTMATNTSGAALIGDGTNFNPVVISGAIAIATNGTATIANDAIDSQHYAAGSIDNEHLADNAVDTDEIAAAAVDFANIQNVAANSILGRNANSSGVLSEVALATTQILIGDGTGFTAAALSGDVTMTNAGVVSIAAGAVDTAHIGDDQVTLAKMASGTDGNVISYDASGNPVAIATGNDGQVLTSTGAGSPPAFEDVPAGSGAQTALTTILNTAVKIGRDSQNLIDFATTDNKIILRVNNSNEVELVENALSPFANDGVALGTTSLGWSDAHLATGGVINWANGEMTITESDANTLTVAGGTFATAALTATTFAPTDDITMAADKSLNFPQGANIKFTDLIGDDTQDDHDIQGIMYTFKAGAAITPFSPVYVDSSNEIQECNANAIATMPCIGVTTNTSAASDHDSVAVMMMGFMRDDDFAFGTAGAPVYASGTVGEMTNTAPSGTDDVVQVIGHSLADDALFVQPCLTTIEHA